MKALKRLAWSCLAMRPIGHIESCWPQKFGTPRQAGLVPAARAALRLDLEGMDARRTTEGLEDFSHVWLIWSFSLNGHAATQAKVRAPRLRGGRAGLFATRSPFRPNPIGLSLVRLDGVEGDTLRLSGVDLVHGTPILDVKPYLPQYDAPAGGEAARYAAWVDAKPLDVRFDEAAVEELEAAARRGDGLLRGDGAALRDALAQSLSADPRPLYRWRREGAARSAAGGEAASAEYDVAVDRVVARCRFERDEPSGREWVRVVRVTRASPPIADR